MLQINASDYSVLRCFFLINRSICLQSRYNIDVWTKSYDKHHEIIGIMEMHFASSDEDGTLPLKRTWDQIPMIR